MNKKLLTPNTVITLRNGQVNFTLPGYANYKVTIDSGCFKDYPITAEKDSGSSRFYLEVESKKECQAALVIRNRRYRKMAMVWNNMESFKEHDKQMRMFRQTHPNNLETRVSRRNLITTIWPLLTAGTMRETEVSTGPAIMMY